MKKVIFKLPEGFLQKLKRLYPKDYQHIVTTFCGKKPSTFRVNYLKADLAELRQRLLKEKVRFKELSFPPGAFLLRMPLRELQKKEVYRQGFIYLQNLSSMLSVIALNPQNGDRVLDLCAAPGTKTTQIASLAPQAEIVAVEKVRVRFYKLLANLKTQECRQVRALLMDGTLVRRKFPEYFDKILVDAPCSAEGRFYLNDPRTYKYWKERKVKEMVRKQKKLLQAAFFALKEGGVLVYSTCTFSPEENEEVVDWFSAKFRGKIIVVDLDMSIPSSRAGLRRWGSRKFNTELRKTRRIMPTELMEGFFVAKLKKTAV